MLPLKIGGVGSGGPSAATSSHHSPKIGAQEIINPGIIFEDVALDHSPRGELEEFPVGVGIAESIAGGVGGLNGDPSSVASTCWASARAPASSVSPPW